MKARAVEFRANVGEGQLARLILRKLVEVNEVITPHRTFNRTNLGWQASDKSSGKDLTTEINTVVGIYYSVWYSFISRLEGSVYLNFAPSWNFLVFLLVSKTYPIYVTGQHAHLRFSNSLGRIIYNCGISASKIIIGLRQLEVRAVNPAVQKQLKLSRSELYHLISGNIPSSFFPADRCEIPPRILNRRVVLVYIGPHPIKRSGELLDWLKPLVNSGEISLKIAGDSKTFESKIRQFDQSRVTVLGRIEHHNFLTLLTEADCFISFSLEESSIALIESSLLCKRVIYKHSPILDQVQDRNNLIRFNELDLKNPFFQGATLSSD